MPTHPNSPEQGAGISSGFGTQPRSAAAGRAFGDTPMVRGGQMNVGSPPTSKPLAGMRVLLAEDSWHIAIALRQTVEMAGATVVGLAATLPQAERLARAANFDAAVMDLNLHNELTVPLVTRLAESGIKVIVISGYDVALGTKVHACLSKPASGQAIIAALLRPLRQA